MKFLLSISIFLFTSSIFAQNYWQQEVNYKISVKLNDKEHSFSAFEEFEYINNSPNSLDFLYIHIWPNAYKNNKTALAKQLYKNGEKELQFGADSLKGWIDSLDFKVNGEKVKWEFDKENIDICKVYLNAPLKSGERINVTTPFKVKIPSGEISRLGHIGQSYQITQWYPKPAVYDKNGWNQMPYLNQGEFYSEYGSFDVSITLPNNYVVGATGDLQTESEIAFLDELAQKTKANLGGNPKNSGKPDKNPSFPTSANEWKTLRYTQKNVHDFAWFADKRYKVLKGEVELPHSKRKVTTWAMFTPKNEFIWKDAIEFINDGTYYYSKWNGDYPYNQVTAVDGTISAGGGMEYPNVTVIGNSNSKIDLEIVIVHEVGHNWFYGILGSNERVHGWMDEGLNTLNEMRYMETKYPNNKQLSDMVFGKNFHFENLNHYDSGDLGYRLISILGEDQPLETHSAEFTSMNYGLIMYQKTGLIFHYLKYYLGENEFDKAMSNYFETWKFRHPQPEDIRATLEKSTGKNLAWMFEDLVQTTNHIDYKIKNIGGGKTSVIKLKNKGQVNGPIPITLYGSKDTTIWFEPDGYEGGYNKKIQFKIDSAQIDPNRQIPELNRSNNNWNSTWTFHKREPFKLEFGLGDNETKRSNNFWLPIIAGNAHDKLMLGLALHNYAVPFNKFQYVMMPLFSFGRKNVSGMAEFSYTTNPKRNFKLIRKGVSIKSFKNQNISSNYDGYYASVSPYLFLKLGNRGKDKAFSSSFLIQGIYRYDQFLNEKTEQVGGYLKYKLDFDKTDHKFNITLRTDYINNINNSNEMGRTTGEVSYKYKYSKNKMERWLELRVFTGTIWKQQLTNSNSLVEQVAYQLSLNGTSGATDFFTEDYFFSRTNSRFGGNQRAEDMGNFKTGETILTSKNLFTSNFYFQLPIKPNCLGVFVDYGLMNDGSKVNSLVNAGIGIRIKSVFGLYFPLWMNKDLNKYFGTDYLEKVRFSLKLNWTNQGLKLANIF